MKSRYILTMAGMMLTFALLTRCGAGPAGGNRTGENATDSGSAQREEELQAEIDSLREELDALKNAQGTQEASETDSSSSPDSENTQDQNSQNSNAAGQSGCGDAAQSQNSGDSSAVQNGGQTSSGAQISMEEAMRIALDRVPGATEQNISIELERDDGWLIYEGDILYNRMEYEFEIDAQSGTMLKWEEESW